MTNWRFCFSWAEFERLKDESTALENAIEEFRQEKDSLLADICSLEESCKEVMSTMLDTIKKYDEIRDEIRVVRVELDACVVTDDLIDLNLE